MTREDCYRCQWYTQGDAGNVCRVSGWGHFDVDKARAIIKRAKKRTVLYDYKKLNKVVNPGSAVYEPHLQHVNTRKAIIVARFKPADGPSELFLLEGRHRAARSLLDRKGLRVYELTKEETQEIFIGKRAPNGKRFISRAR